MESNRDSYSDGTATDGALPLALGTRDGASGRVGFIRFGDYDCEIDADQADELSASLRGIAVELRNGGRLG